MLVSASYAPAHADLLHSGAVVVATVGMRVRACDPQMARTSSGRVLDGTGVVISADNALGNLSVVWEGGDRTIWTRAGADSTFDVQRETDRKSVV